MTRQPEPPVSDDALLDDIISHRGGVYDGHGKIRPSLLKRCALCFGSAAGGGLLAHIGCVTIPLAAALGGTAGAMGPVAGAGLSALGLGAWYGLSGRKQSPGKRALVVAFAAAGTIGVAAMHMPPAMHENELPANVDPLIYKLCLQTGATPAQCALICG